MFRFFSHKRDKSRAKTHRQDVKEGVHPKAIFHDLYVKKKSGGDSQIDRVVAIPQGLVVIEVKNYSGWLFGNVR